VVRGSAARVPAGSVDVPFRVLGDIAQTESEDAEEHDVQQFSVTAKGVTITAALLGGHRPS
jgi:hypothetical protein